MVKIMENPIKIDDLGGTSIFGNTHVSSCPNSPNLGKNNLGRMLNFFSLVSTIKFKHTTPSPSFLSKLSKQSFPTSQNEPFYPSPVSLIKTTPNSLQCQPRNLRSMLLVCIQFTTSGNKELTSLPTVIAWITW